MVAWAREQGIDGRSLNAWRLNLARTDRRLEERALPELRMLELVPATCAEATYKVRCGPFVVEVDAAFDDQTLRRLLAVVAAC